MLVLRPFGLMLNLVEREASSLFPHVGSKIRVDLSRLEPPVPSSTRNLWFAFFMLASLVGGVGAGVLKWAGGDNPFNAVLFGFGAGGATFVVLVGAFHFIAAGSKGMP
jgi:hypothetical protein